MSDGARPAVPAHVAIIMDGNGRWAQMRGLPRQEGHRRGLEALRRTVRNAADLGIRVLTLYSFSTENWRRPITEVSFLMGLLRRFVENDLTELKQAGVCVRIIGNRENLPPDLRALVERAETMTAGNTGLTLVVAFNYGSRDEITRVARRLAQEAAAGRLAREAIDEAMLSSHFDTG
ncbi:MAG: di-trans,poly-cis-decaprenylcistransferase, partial [Hyphomicrobiales bacterium]